MRKPNQLPAGLREKRRLCRRLFSSVTYSIDLLFVLSFMAFYLTHSLPAVSILAAFWRLGLGTRLWWAMSQCIWKYHSHYTAQFSTMFRYVTPTYLQSLPQSIKSALLFLFPSLFILGNIWKHNHARYGHFYATIFIVTVEYLTEDITRAALAMVMMVRWRDFSCRRQQGRDLILYSYSIGMVPSIINRTDP